MSAPPSGREGRLLRTVLFVAVALQALLLGAQPLLELRLLATGVAVAAATLAAAGVFRPARRAIQARVDRRFNRTRYDAELVVAAFREQLRPRVELADVVATTRAAAVGTVEPARASLWLRTGDAPR